MPLGHIPFEDVPLVEFMYLVFTSYRRRPRSVLCLCDVFQTLNNSLVCARPLVLFLARSVQVKCCYNGLWIEQTTIFTV